MLRFCKRCDVLKEALSEAISPYLMDWSLGTHSVVYCRSGFMARIVGGFGGRACSSSFMKTLSGGCF